MMDYRKIAGIVVVVVLAAFLFAILVYGLVNLPDFYTGVAVTLVGMIVGIAYWTFRPELNKLFKESVGNIESTFVENEIKKSELTVEYDEYNIEQYSPFVGDGHRVLRVRVRNKGDESAENCEARLEAFDSNGISMMQEQYLQWSKEDGTKIEVPKHDSVFLNVVFSTKNGVEDRIVFASTTQSSDFKKSPRVKDGLKVGKYQLRLRIKPPSLNDALYVIFDLDVKEKWEEISMSKIDEYLSSE